MFEHMIVVEKLAVLLFIQKMGVPLSNTHITHFILLKEYMDFFTLQKNLDQLIDAKYLRLITHNGEQMYTITDAGTAALSCFRDMIPRKYRKDISTYVIEHRGEIANSIDIAAHCFPQDDGSYIVKCAIVEVIGETVIDMSILAVDKASAETIRGNWKANANVYYKDIIEKLTAKSAVKK